MPFWNALLEGKVSSPAMPWIRSSEKKNMLPSGPQDAVPGWTETPCWYDPEVVRACALEFIDLAEQESKRGGVFTGCLLLCAPADIPFMSLRGSVCREGRGPLVQASVEVGSSLMGHALLWLQDTIVDWHGRAVPWSKRRVLCPEYMSRLPLEPTSWLELADYVRNAPIVLLEPGEWMKQECPQAWVRIWALRSLRHWWRQMDQLLTLPAQDWFDLLFGDDSNEVVTY